eukprot:6529568-Pyramimonas_sp.AAC.2
MRIDPLAALPMRFLSGGKGSKFCFGLVARRGFADGPARPDEGSLWHAAGPGGFGFDAASENGGRRRKEEDERGVGRGECGGYLG